MIYFFADNHYGVFPGKVIYEHLPEKLRTRILFYCDEWAALEHSDWDSDCELLILNMIGGTCDQPHPGMDAEKRHIHAARTREWSRRKGDLPAGWTGIHLAGGRHHLHLRALTPHIVWREYGITDQNAAR